MDAIANNFNAIINQHPTLFVLLTIWTLVWKGLALWKASGKRQPIWFVILLVLNSLGLLEILYYFFFSKIQRKNKTTVGTSPESSSEEKNEEK